MIGIVPIHPVAEPHGLFGLHGREFEDAGFAQLHKFGEAVLFDVALVGEAQLFFDVDFNPQPLTVEAVLPAQIFALHGVVSVVEVFVGAPPGVVNAHRVVGGDGAVKEAECAVFGFGLGAKAAQFVECVGVLPEFEDFVFHFYEVGFV